jgi:hypothetical protein
MSANEIANRVHAMITFHPAATQGAITVYRTVGVDEAAPGTTRGVERLATGRYKVYLVDKVTPPTNPAGPDIVGFGTSDAGFILSVGADTDGNMLVGLDTNAGAATDAPSALCGCVRFPTPN